MGKDESISHMLLKNKIKRGTITLPIGTSVSSLSEQQCAEILSILRLQIGLPKMTDWSDSLLSSFDPFYSISDPFGYLLRLSRELQCEASSWEEYTTNYTDDLIEMYKEESSKKRLVYEETCHHIHENICCSIRGPKYLLSAIYMHQNMIYSIQEAASLVMQAMTILQLIVEKSDEAYFRFTDALKYYVYEVSLDETGKWDMRIVENESRKTEKLTLEDYEFAIEEIRNFTKWVEENRIAFRLEELGARLGVFCKINATNPEEIDRLEAAQKDEQITALLDKEITQIITKVLGTGKKKRIQIVKETQYEEGGYMGSTLHELKRFGILKHKRPYFWVNPVYYKRLHICPDKEGQ